MLFPICPLPFLPQQNTASKPTTVRTAHVWSPPDVMLWRLLPPSPTTATGVSLCAFDPSPSGAVPQHSASPNNVFGGIVWPNLTWLTGSYEIAILSRNALNTTTTFRRVAWPLSLSVIQ